MERWRYRIKVFGSYLCTDSSCGERGYMFKKRDNIHALYRKNPNNRTMCQDVGVASLSQYGLVVSSSFLCLVGQILGVFHPLFLVARI